MLAKLVRGLAESGVKPVVRSGKLFGFDACLAHNGHEIRIASPARQHVKMQMADDAGARRAPQVHADIEPFGAVCLLHRGLHSLRELHHLAECRGVGGGQVRHMRVGNDHHVTAGVWIAIQDDEIFLGSKQDQRFTVFVGANRIAENTTVSRFGAGNVAISPGRPQIIHPA